MKIQRISNYFKKALVYSKLRNFSTFKPTHNFTNVKISNKIDKFANDEENIANLINEMTNTKNNSESNLSNYKNYLIQKDDVIFISNYSHNNILSDIKLGQFLVFDKKYHAQCIAIKENLLIFILLNRQKYTTKF